MQIKLPNDTSLWARRLALYFSLYVLIIVSHLFFRRFDWWHTDVDSARNLLSGLVQIEAAIVAIVISFSLVAIELAASSYSTRAIEVFRKTPDLWILIGIYGISMFYGLGVLKLIEKANQHANSLSNLEVHISFSYYLGIFAFVALVPYIWKTLDMLRPSTVINILSEKITKTNILAIEKGQDNPIQPITDIIRGSLMNYDYETLRDGLRAISDRANFILETKLFEIKKDEVGASMGKEREVAEMKEVDVVLGIIVLALAELGKLAINIKNEKSSLEIINSLNEITVAAVTKQKLKGTTAYALFSLKEIGIIAAKQKLEDALWEVISSIEEIGRAAAEQEQEPEGSTLWAAARYLAEVGKMAFKQKLGERVTRQVLYSLAGIGMVATQQNLPDVAHKVIDDLKELIKIDKGYNLEYTVPPYPQAFMGSGTGKWYKVSPEGFIKDMEDALNELHQK